MTQHTHTANRSFPIKVVLIFTLLVLAFSVGIWTVWGRSAAGKRAQLATVGVHKTDIRGGKIILSAPLDNMAEGALTQSGWTMVQWQAGNGQWVDVEGWQGSFHFDASTKALFVEWWVGEEIMGQGPFRWVIYPDHNRSQILSISDVFYLPTNDRESIWVVPQIGAQAAVNSAPQPAALAMANTDTGMMAQPDGPSDFVPAAPISQSLGETFYVSADGDNTDGLSWQTAWNELDQIDWSLIGPNDVIYLDGGESAASPMVYRTALKPAASGSEGAPITVQLSAESGRDGQAVLFGGNGVLLPECGQLDWDESQYANAKESAIKFENGVSNIVVNGRKRKGIVILGWRKNGVEFDPDRIDNGIDDNTHNITLQYLEIFNNGGITRVDDGATAGVYLPSNSGAGIKFSGVGHRFHFLEIHDNAADAIQSNFTDPANGVFNNMDDFALTDSWLYNQRVHSGFDNSPLGEVCTLEDKSGCDELGAPQMGVDYLTYPSEPAFRQEAFNWCTHNDGIQIYSGDDFNQLTIERSIIGPNLMTALLLGDRNSETTTAWVNDLTLKDVVITRFMHSALGMKNPLDNAGTNWTLDNVTIYGHFSNTNKGTVNIDSNAAAIDHSITNSTMVYGRTEFPNGNVFFENNCQYGLYAGSLEGLDSDPKFTTILERDVFENNIAVDFATVFTDDYTPLNDNCASSVSRTTSVDVLLSSYNFD